MSDGQPQGTTAAAGYNVGVVSCRSQGATVTTFSGTLRPGARVTYV